jgi:hypothetical protein
MREYSRVQTVISNLPYVVMLVLGAATIVYGFGSSRWAWLGAGGYVAYGIAGAFWIMVFICPFCVHYGTRGCPCGYGEISRKIVEKGGERCFAEKFRRHIPVIVPLWLIPVICGGIALWQFFSWVLAAIVGAFVLNSYIVLPLLSKRHSCVECPQEEECPWMQRGE